MNGKTHSLRSLYKPAYFFDVRNEVQKTDVWFFLALTIWITRFFLAITLYLPFVEALGPRTLLLVVTVLLAVGELSNRHDKRAVAGLALFIVAGLVSWYTNRYELFTTALFIYCARSIDFRRIAYYSFLLISSLLFFVTISSLLGIIPDYLWGLDEVNGRIRHGLGFRYTTFPTHLFLEIVLLYGFLAREKAKISVLLVFFAINYAMYEMTESRNSFLLVLFFLIFLVAMKFPQLRSMYTPRFQRFTAAWVYPLGALASYIAARLYSPDSQFFTKLNTILSNRLAQTHASLEEYGIRLFGQKINFMGNGIDANGKLVKTQGGDYDFNFVDNSFMNILINNGLLLLILTLIAFTLLGIRSAKANDRIMSAILFIIALHSMIDPQLIDLTYNVFLLALLGSAGVLTSTHDMKQKPQQSPARHSSLSAYAFPYATYVRR